MLRELSQLGMTSGNVITGFITEHAPGATSRRPGPGSKSAVRQYEQELEQKERAIRE